MGAVRIQGHRAVPDGNGGWACKCGEPLSGPRKRAREELATHLEGIRRDERELEEARRYIDPVAIERALAGDRKVFERLTMYEERHLFTLIEQRLEADRRETREWREFYLKHSDGTSLTAIVTPWFDQWCASVGVPPARVRRRIYLRRARAKQRANAIPVAA